MELCIFAQRIIWKLLENILRNYYFTFELDFLINKPAGLNQRCKGRGFNIQNKDTFKKLKLMSI